jgi:hypothetical protein
MHYKTPKVGILTAALLTATSLFGKANAAVVFQVDLSDPAVTRIIATSALSGTDSNLSIGLDGITIENFFTSSVLYPQTTTFGGNLSPSGTSVTYDGLGTFDYSDNSGNFKAGDDLSVFANATGAQDFSTSETAFTGEAEIDFSAAVAELPQTVGATGNVISGYFNSGTADHGEIIGQWEVIAVVPEPSFNCLLGLGFALCATGRRRHSI